MVLAIPGLHWRDRLRSIAPCIEGPGLVRRPADRSQVHQFSLFASEDRVAPSVHRFSRWIAPGDPRRVRMRELPAVSTF